MCETVAQRDEKGSINGSRCGAKGYSSPGRNSAESVSVEACDESEW